MKPRHTVYALVTYDWSDYRIMGIYTTRQSALENIPQNAYKECIGDAGGVKKWKWNPLYPIPAKMNEYIEILEFPLLGPIKIKEESNLLLL